MEQDLRVHLERMLTNEAYAENRANLLMKRRHQMKQSEVAWLHGLFDAHDYSLGKPKKGLYFVLRAPVPRRTAARAHST